MLTYIYRSSYDIKIRLENANNTFESIYQNFVLLLFFIEHYIVWSLCLIFIVIYSLEYIVICT